MKKAILFTVLFFISFQVFSQQKHVKFGQINDKNLKMTVYDKDSSANAVVIFKYGEGKFVWDDINFGFQYVLKVHKRIKILSNDGLDRANVEIYFSKKYDNITSVKAASYSLENNSTIKTKLKKNEIIEEKYNDNTSIKKFTFPNVKVGTIIEYEYTLTTSSLYQLDRWYFQEEIPCMYNELDISILEYFDYRVRINGYLNINSKNSLLNEKIPIKISNYESYTADSQTKETLYWIEDVPALKAEKYISNKKNYLSYIDFELLRLTKFDKSVVNYTTSWNEINQKLIDNEHFGKQLSSNNSIKKQVEEIVKDKTTDYDKMVAIYNWVKNNIKWNKTNRLYTSKTVKNVLNDKTGSSAEINILLIDMLNEANIITVPVILSTRDNGFIIPGNPSIADFNYVIALSKIGANDYYLDATDIFCPAGLLPERCLNGTARVAGTHSYEIDIRGEKKFISKALVTLKLKDEKLIGTYSGQKDNYAAVNYRNIYTNRTSDEKFIEDLEDNFSGMSITDFTIDNLDDIYKPLKIKFNFTVSNKIDILGDKIYFNPMLYWGEDENPFKIEKRGYPVDFAYPMEFTYFLMFTIPDDYVVESLPEAQIVTLPNNTAEFMYNAVVLGNTIKITSKFSFNKSLFSQDEYPLLKQFYSIVVKKHSEQIVLKKAE